MLKQPCICLSFAALLSGFGSGAAFGAPPLPREALMHMEPADPRAHLEAQVAGQEAGGAGSQAAALDVTPPVLTMLNASKVLNLDLAQQSFAVQIKATDDLSGIRWVYFYAVGPSGQRILGFERADYPSTNYSRRSAFSFNYNPRLLEPGAWTIDKAGVKDVAGNEVEYYRAEVAALGNTAFTVVNTAGYDSVPPTLTSGQILTSTVSLSAPAKGTPSQPPYIGVKIKATDAGTTALAGLAGAVATFCLADGSHCFYAWGTTNGAGQAAATFVLGTQVSPDYGDVPGEYLLWAVFLYDQAGNLRELYGLPEGGTTDFSTLFPTTKITLKP